jgi:hypothetical protein
MRGDRWGPELFAVAEELCDVLEKSWRLPHGGYYEGEIAVCPPFRQNPHMTRQAQGRRNLGGGDSARQLALPHHMRAGGAD